MNMVAKAARGMSAAGRQVLAASREFRREQHPLEPEMVPAFFARFAFYVACCHGGRPGEPRPEIVLRDALRGLGLPAFVPVGVNLGRASVVGRRKRKPGPQPYLLFPGYVLAGTGPGLPRLEAAFGLDELAGFLGAGGIPAKVSQRHLGRLIDSLNDGRFDESRWPKEERAPFAVGQLVEILDGHLTGHEGPIEAISVDRQGHGDAKVRLGQTALAPLVTIPVDSLRKART